MLKRRLPMRVYIAAVLLGLGILLMGVIFWGSGDKPQPLPHIRYRPELFDAVKDSRFVGFNNETGTVNGKYIIPNIVHFLFFEESRITYVAAVCVLAAF
jgi:hypothetical protein